MLFSLPRRPAHPLQIFISYRRNDSSGYAGRLYDSLADVLGDENVGLDQDDFAAGGEFALEARHMVAESGVLLALIGKQWAEGVNATRLADPADLLRQEIETALAKGKRVIPVLLDGAALPDAAVLPASLRPLLKLNAVELSGKRWDYDVGQLVATLGGRSSRIRAGDYWMPLSVVAYAAVFWMVFQPEELWEAFEQGKAGTQQAAVAAAAVLPVALLLAWLHHRRISQKPVGDAKVATAAVLTVLLTGAFVVAALAAIARNQVNEEAIAIFESAREYDLSPDISGPTLYLAEQQYTRATTLDPNFALAFAYLSKLHMRLYFLGYDETPARLDRAREAIDRARELNRNLPQTSLSEGYYYYWGLADYARAESAFGDARRGRLRRNPDVSAGIGYVQRRRGRWSEALENLRRAAELDPGNADRLTEVGHTYNALHCYPDAERAYRSALAIAPHARSTAISLAEVHLRSTGRPDSLALVAASLPGHIDPDGEFLVFKVKASLLMQDSATALRLLLQAYKPEIERQGFIYTTSMLRGIVRAYSGNSEGAAAPLDSARADLMTMLRDEPRKARLHLALSQTYAALGVRDSAMIHAETALRLLRDSRGDDALDLPDYQLNQAAVYAWVGETGKALDLLTHLVGVAAGPSPHELRLDPVWLPLRGEPRFNELTSRRRRCLLPGR
jgi:tetratricopeptide (TPR) repeat protein